MKAVLNTIAFASAFNPDDSKKITRLDIAHQTGLSLMTVGKAIDMMLECGIILQSKELKTAAGRKAGIVELNSSKYFIVFDISTENFFAEIIDISLKVKDWFYYPQMENRNTYKTLTPDKKIEFFIKNAYTYFAQNHNLNSCTGIGVIVNGEYHEKTDTLDCPFSLYSPDLKLKDCVKSTFNFPSIPVTITGILPCVARALNFDANNPVYATHSSVLYLNLAVFSTGSLFCISNDRQILQLNKHTNAPVKLIMPNKNLYRNGVLQFDDIDAVLAATAEIIYNILCISSIDAIIVDSMENFSKSELIPYFQKNTLLDHLVDNLDNNEKITPPKVIAPSNMLYSHRGIVIGMREQWFSSLLY